MLLDVDVTAVPVLVVGAPDETAATLRRFSRAGAVVSTAQSPAEAAASAGQPWLAVVVGAAREWPEVALLRERRPVVEVEASLPRGRVILVGAGPGGAGLLTVDAVAALADADVVLADRLAHVGDLSLLAPGAEVIDVGKRPGHHAMPQHKIETLMVERAAIGLTVVRLKGGDPYVYGRGGEEVEAAASVGLPVSVVPGVTSAVAVPGKAGIPVTHRGVSHVFTVVSGHVPLTSRQAESLVGLGGTVVVLMGVHNLVPLTTALLSAGLEHQTPAAVVESGFTPDMRSTVAPLDCIADAALQAGVTAPAVVVIGDVVRQSPVWQQRRGDLRPAPSVRHDGFGNQAQRRTAIPRQAESTGART